MFKNFKILNFKSIENIDFDLGRVNVFVGENGAGKSNILEAIAFAGAASAGKLDSEFLTARGIRVTQPEFMRSAFDRKKTTGSIRIEISATSGGKKRILLENDNAPYSQWREVYSANDPRRHLDFLNELVSYHKNLSRNIKSIEENMQRLRSREKELQKVYGSGRSVYSDKLAQKTELPKIRSEIDRLMIEYENIKRYKPSVNDELERNIQDMMNKIQNEIKVKDLGVDLKSDELMRLRNFIVFSPENTALRTFEREGQIEPLGINGEGLFKLLAVLSDSPNKKSISTIKENLSVLSWFKNFEVISRNDESHGRIELEDNFIDDGYKYFDQKSSNEGFLLLLFYFSLFSTELTPSFFAIDNIDSSLNPKLCKRLMELLVSLAKNNDKQVLLTTHNPAILDGIDLNDPDQCIFVVSRNSDGFTKIKKITKPQAVGGSVPLMKISEMFYRGMIGGLPKGF